MPLRLQVRAGACRAVIARGHMTDVEKKAPSLWEPELGGCFGNDDHEFAKHELDRKRAATYLASLVHRGVGWSAFGKQVEAYLKSHIGDAAVLKDRLSRVECMMKPWLPD